MACPRCGRKSKKAFQGYCSEVHQVLSKGKKGKNVRLFCAVCDRPIFRKPSRVPKKGKAVCSRCSKNQGENHWNFKGAKYQDTKGYMHILVNNRYVLEHRYVWQTANRASLLQWQPGAIHHVNFNKSFNHPNNLLLLSNEEHARVHKFLSLGRIAEAYEIMHKRGLEQLHYPREIEAYNPSGKSLETCTKEKKGLVEALRRESDSTDLIK